MRLNIIKKIKKEKLEIMIFTIYKSDLIGADYNVDYAHEIKINDINDFKEAVSKDYVCAKYKDNKRSKANFIVSDCMALDFDNDHSENPDEWIDKEDVMAAFPGVTLAFHYSRHHMKPKKGLVARPRFHVFMPIRPIYSHVDYSNLKANLKVRFPYCDECALDSARFFYGTKDPEVEIVKGDMNLTDFLEEEEFDKDFDKIKEGSRNTTMSRYAARVLKRYGDSDEAYSAFLEKSSLCEPLLDDEELDKIWKSALKFYKKISSMPGYVPPEKYNDSNSYKPLDFTDVGQATVLAKYFKDVLRYSPATRFIRFKDTYWEESEIGAQAVVHELTRRQLKEVEMELIEVKKLLKESGAQDIVDEKGKKAEEFLDEKQLEILKRYAAALKYQKFVLGRRESKYITACLKEVKPMIEIKASELDANPFLLCTPDATYDLRIGMASARAHNPTDFITKCTAVSPSDKGKDIWIEALNKIFAKNPELIDYVQLVCGLSAIGKVMVEGMIIAYGDGGNGKSTFWNAIFRTLGLYSGKISADTLTTQCRRNTKPEMAEAKGKRLLIASESQQGARLDESMVKQLCSTDEVEAEKKYKDPFHYVPCHTLVLYTNYLPRVSGIDDGIWSRLFVIPFNNKLRGGKDDIKNYADFLFENAGEYILKWIIDGAKKVIDLNYRLPLPLTISKAISEYRELNNWFNHFIEDCCEVDSKLKESSNALYISYRKYAQENGEYVRSTTEFYSTLEKNGYKRIVEKRIKYIKGLKLVDKYNEASIDFLT